MSEPPSDRRHGPKPPVRQNVAAVESMYQFLLWLIPMLDSLPRSQKFLLGDRIQTTALNVLEHLVEAAYTRERTGLLKRSNLGLEKLRFWLRLTKDLHLIDFRRYEHGARCIDEVGRQVGGWLRAQRPLPPTDQHGDGHGSAP